MSTFDKIETALKLYNNWDKIVYPVYISNAYGNWRIDSESSEPVLIVDCDICGNYHEPDAIPRSCETGDGE